MASDELQSVSEMEQIMSYLRTLQADVQTGMQSVRSDLQSLSDCLQKVQEGESQFDQSQTPSPSPHPAQRASTDVLPSLPSSSRSWADRVEQEDDDDAFEHSMDLDVEPGDDAKGIRIFPLEEATESFFSQALSSPLPSQVRRQLRERFGKPNLPKATTPYLDIVMRPLMSSQAKELAKIQTFCLDAYAPLARYINEANSDSGQLSAADYLKMVRKSARLLGNCNLSTFCSRLRRSSVLQSVNSRIVDMADEEEIFQDAGRKLFGEGFTKKTKESDDELKSLVAQQVGGRRKAPTSRRFFSPAVKPQWETSPRLQTQQREATFWTLPPHSGVEEGRLMEVTGSTTTPGGDRVTSLVSIRNKNSENPNNFVVLSVEHGYGGYERRCSFSAPFEEGDVVSKKLESDHVRPVGSELRTRLRDRVGGPALTDLYATGACISQSRSRLPLGRYRESAPERGDITDISALRRDDK